MSEAQTAKKRSAGILLVRVIQGRLVIFLRRRAADDSWGGALQVTSHGGWELVDGGGYPATTVAREMVEELKCTPEFAQRAVSRMKPLGTGVDTPEKEVRTFYLVLHDSDTAEINRMQDQLEAIGIEDVDKIKEMFDPLPDGSKPTKRSKLPADELRMFDDERQSVLELVRLYQTAQM